MNIIDIIIIAILGVSLVSGMYKGFISSGLVVLGFIAAWFGARATYSMLADAILANSSFMSWLSSLLDAGSLFGDAQIAATTVSDALASGSAAFSTAMAAVEQKLPLLADAFSKNVQMHAFDSLQISTLAEYLDQTIWTAAFQLVSFLLLFFLFYAAATLVVNLLSRVFRFPALRGLDALVGGVFGLIRGYILVLLLIAIIPMIVEVVNIPSLVELKDSSRLVGAFNSFKIFDIEAWIKTLLV